MKLASVISAASAAKARIQPLFDGIAFLLGLITPMRLPRTTGLTAK
jgi:hypothetical protein